MVLLLMWCMIKISYRLMKRFLVNLGKRLFHSLLTEPRKCIFLVQSAQRRLPLLSQAHQHTIPFVLMQETEISITVQDLVGYPKNQKK
ncbi:Os11g0220400 [Oryza sativa Japonica Group]|uniref:Os11g0220400 protein n=1 Tax=Oryza sativa subsp. japonica TaxID=39947 RepID=Q0ITT0_ORYSJ|nr:Os11g0220400 [Oryza sativa Japonica Group]|eukprot:NP_001067522.1 Os11g0220400 [Oryza sativa Japonica Group]